MYIVVFPILIMDYALFLDAINFTNYNFFHDTPTYSGMSGGPIFHLAPAVGLGGLNIIEWG